MAGKAWLRGDLGNVEKPYDLCYHDEGSVIMVRTQIQLTKEQSSRLKALASRRKISMAELIRQGVDALLDQGETRTMGELRRRAAQAAGRFRSGDHDVALRHDEYLGREFLR
jgi:predicted DNA-binding protein